MKKRLAYILLTFLGLVAIETQLMAQTQNAPTANVGCIDPKIRQQAEHIKQFYLKQGFETKRDAMINMSSMQPFPVMVQLEKGRLYEIIYVGKPDAPNHIMELYDGDQKKLFGKELFKKKKELPENYIIYEFTPERTDTYLLILTTKSKSEDFCGSVSVLATDPNKPGFVAKPYHP